MDISTLELPLRSEKRTAGLFHLRPPLSSVNVCYETAEAVAERSPQPEPHRSAPRDETEDKLLALAIDRTSDDSDESGSKANSEISAHSESSATGDVSASPQQSPPKPFPVKVKSLSHQSLKSLQRPSFSGTASDECQTFIRSLKEPKYAKPLTADEISWLFQDFYRKLHQDLLGVSDEGRELLSVEEQEDQKQQTQHIDAIIDRAERAVAGGELYSKLFSLGGSHDAKLNPRISALRENEPLVDLLLQKLELDPAIKKDLTGSRTYLNRLNRETAPKAKVHALIRAHQALVEATDASSSADTVFPVFVLALVTSQVDNWWQTFLFIQRFRRASCLSGRAAYCLTNLEAAIHFVEQLTLEESELPEGVDAQLFAKPIANPRTPRDRSGSQSSRASTATTNSTTGSFGQRIGDTLSSYRNLLLTARRPSLTQPPAIDTRFLNADADSLTLAEVRNLLREYKRLAEFIERQRQ